MESYNNARRGTNTMVILKEWNAGYWYKRLLPKPVGRLTRTSWDRLQLMIAFCNGLRGIWNMDDL
jgi:hypothetical protein